jgi:hypothetical protein
VVGVVVLGGWVGGGDNVGILSLQVLLKGGFRGGG